MTASKSQTMTMVSRCALSAMRNDQYVTMTVRAQRKEGTVTDIKHRDLLSEKHP